MANYTVRVELYGSPSAEVYKQLLAKMQSKGFTDGILDNLKQYTLPPAEYMLFDSALDTVQVLELAKSAASAVWKDYAVLATKTEVRFEHYNLKPRN